MTKHVMIRLYGHLSGLSARALYILFCSRLFGWTATFVIVGVQLGIAGWIIYMRIRAPDQETVSTCSTSGYLALSGGLCITKKTKEDD